MEKWKSATGNNDMMVLGDINLDLVKWGNPEYGAAKMVDKVKLEIETLGFHQMVKGITRAWNGKPDSCIYHCWMNTPARLFFCKKKILPEPSQIIIFFSCPSGQEIKFKISMNDTRETGFFLI